MKIEIGGGTTPHGDGFLNLDILPCADTHCDFELGTLPFPDDSVDAIYSAHCLEHVGAYLELLREVLRVGKVGAPFELHLPHWLHPMASCPGHLHVLSDRQVAIWIEFPERFFPGPKRFVEKSRHYQIDVDYNRLREKFPLLTDEEVAMFIPGCCHEVHYFLEIAG